MDTTTTLPNLQHDHQTSTNGSITTTTTTTTTITTLNNPLKLINTTKANPFLSKLKCVKKKRTAGKKDKQSKIHTAQGLRDRRMRLSVHTARKFFDLNDMLGFDKASKTIEWLFTKSHKAIQEVTENLQSDAAAGDQTVNRISKDIAASFSAGDEDPSVDFHQSQLKSLKSSDDHNMKESSCYPMEFADTYYFLKHLHLDNNNNNNYNKSVRNTNAYVGNIITTNQPTNHSIFDYNKSVGEPSDCWLNSRNSLLGFVGGWNTGNPTMESNNRIAPSNGDTNRLR